MDDREELLGTIAGYKDVVEHLRYKYHQQSNALQLQSLQLELLSKRARRLCGQMIWNTIAGTLTLFLSEK